MYFIVFYMYIYFKIIFLSKFYCINFNGNFYLGEIDVNSFGQLDFEVCKSFGNGCEADEIFGE